MSTIPAATTTGADLRLDPLELLRDLEAGRGAPSRPAARLLELPGQRRPVVGGARAAGTWLVARTLGVVAPRLARRALGALWFTPWIHGSAAHPVRDLPFDAVGWQLSRPDGTVLRGFEAGQGPTVLLVHGWGGRGADWRHLAADLVGAGRRVVVPDLPAHGATAGTTTDVLELRDAVAAVLRHERPGAVVAHSLGSAVTALALEQPDVPRPRRLVLVAPVRSAARALAVFAARTGLSPRLVTELRAAIDDRFAEDVFDLIDTERAVAGLRVPGLVVHDRDDRETTVEDGAAVAAAWEGAELVVTEGLGHRRVLRDPDVLARVLAGTELG